MAKRTTNPELPVDSPERRRLPILLRRAWYGLNQAFRRRVAHLNITPDQFTAMRTLLEAGSDGLVQSELAKRMASDPNTIASLVERMERAKLIERRTHEKDRRANRIQLTAIGAKKYTSARDVAVQLQSEILSGLPEDRREEFLADLGNVAEACRNAVETSPRGKKQVSKAGPGK